MLDDKKMSGKSIFIILKKALVIYTYFLQILPKKCRYFIWSLTSVFQGYFALGTRYALVKGLSKQVGDNIYIGTNVTIKNHVSLEVGSNVSIHDACYLDAYGGLVIGDNVSIAHQTSVITFNHTWEDKSKPIKYNPVVAASIIIEDDVWIGCGVRIMPGVRIGNRSVIAAGSVVTKNVSPGTLVAGVPARKIKDI